jgi:hypothetical protein
MKRVFFVVALLVGSLLAGLAISASASAAVPCRDRIFNDWYHDGRIASSYPTSCYRDALRHIPADAKVYSSLATDINSAMLASIHRQQGKSAPKEVGHGLKAMQSGSNGQLVSLGNPSTPHDPAADGTAPSSASPASAASATGAADSGSSPPLPILVLGGVALALAAAGAVGTGVRHVRRRR